MQKLILFLIVIIFSTCKKESASTQLSDDNGCINRLVIPVNSQGTLTTSDFILVKSLFTTNGINFQNFRFSRTYRDSTITYNGTYDYRSVYIIQYTNGLPIFGESLNFLFQNQSFHNLSGNLTNGTTLDTIPTLRLAQLRKLFIDDIQNFDQNGNLYKDSCVNAEFGYIDLNSGIPNTTEKLVKAWHLTPINQEYPQAVYQDITGQRVYYNDGIVSYH